MKLPSRRISLFAVPLTLAILLGLVWISRHGGASLAGAGEPTAGQKPKDPQTLQPTPTPRGEDRAPASHAAKPKKLKRVGSVVGVNEATMQQYIILHDHVWPEVLKRIHDSNIRNYSIFSGQLDDGKYYLFSYFEYVGDDFDGDMAAIGADPVTRDWWKLTDPLQRRVQGTPVGDQWKTIKQVFHAD
jgi:L-rhamnose mutarotase